MKSIKQIEKLSGKRVIVRVDFNVPIKDGKILDDFRIKKSLPTIEYLHKKGARVILIAHLGEAGTETLAPVAKKIKKYIPQMRFIDSPILSDETKEAIEKMKKKDIFLLENLRREPGEVKDSPSFARALSRYGDVYVNEAFSVSHRLHASIIGIPKYLPSYAGFQLEEEIKNLSQAFKPPHPFLFILGGAKFETKMPLIKKFIHSADTVFICGALANDFYKAKGYDVGKSLVGNGNFEIASLLKQKNLILPPDVLVTNGKKKRFTKPNEIKSNEYMVDAGKDTIELLKNLVSKSKFILWNGPLGKYEYGFAAASDALLRIIANSDAKSIIGGGDTDELISRLKLEKKLGFVSTGGGATLDFLVKGTLPGIKALK